MYTIQMKLLIIRMLLLDSLQNIIYSSIWSKKFVCIEEHAKGAHTMSIKTKLFL